MARRPARKSKPAAAKATNKQASPPSIQSGDKAPIDCVIAICDGFNLLMPSATVAEVVSGVATEFISDEERPWLQGTLSWRGKTVPLISFETHLLQRKARIRGSHVAILYGTEDTKIMPFYGVTIQAFPHSVQVQSERELELREDSRYQNILAATTLRGIATVVPDLEAIQQAVLSADLPEFETGST